MAKRRCRYGKLKHPVGGRRCRRTPLHKGKKRHVRRGLSKRAKKGGLITLGVLAALGIGAVVMVPKLVTTT